MELALFFYLAGIVGQIQVFSCIMTFLLGFGIIIAVIISTIEGLWENWPKNLFSKLIFSWLFVGTLCVFTPDKETMYTMAAAYGVQTAAENPNVQRVAGKSLQVLEGKLDEFIKEGKKE